MGGLGTAHDRVDAVLRVGRNGHEFPMIGGSVVQQLLGITSRVSLHYHILPGTRRLSCDDQGEGDDNHREHNTRDKAFKVQGFHIGQVCERKIKLRHSLGVAGTLRGH
jgi:hypothetical protein